MIMLMIIVLIIGIFNFLQFNRNTDSPGASIDGKQLAAQYCQSCHLLPEPSLLPKQYWNNAVLPVMGLFLGIKANNSTATPNETERSLMPDKPLLPQEDWQALVKYYVDEAPEQLPPVATVPVIQSLPGFELVLPPKEFYYSSCIASYCGIDTTVKPAKMYVGDASRKQLLQFDHRLSPGASTDLAGPLVDMNLQGKNKLACVIGNDLPATDERNGFLSTLQVENAVVKMLAGKILDSLARPVQVATADINNDGHEDFVVAQFGNLVGELSWFEKVDGKYPGRAIKKLAGVVHFVLERNKQTGLIDVWALFSQGDECIIKFTNRGGGKFEEKIVLRFPPTYGSSYFDLVDLNNDGAKDIIYTCGDNGDYSRILKPYHGLYIFLNDGEGFKAHRFHPINGCYKALARDYDQDGDIDIATISFFPAAANPWEAFVYLENKGNLQFQAYTLPGGTPFEKGITMDANAIDGDGKIDIILGNGYYSSGSVKQPLFVLLKNRIAEKSKVKSQKSKLFP